MQIVTSQLKFKLLYGTFLSFQSLKLLGSSCSSGAMNPWGWAPRWRCPSSWWRTSSLSPVTSPQLWVSWRDRQKNCLFSWKTNLYSKGRLPLKIFLKGRGKKLGKWKMKNNKYFRYDYLSETCCGCNILSSPAGYEESVWYIATCGPWLDSSL